MSHYPASGTWQACPKCGRHVHQRQWGTYQQCPYCHYWQRLTTAQRLEQLVDEGSFQPLTMTERPVNQLGFPDYMNKLRRAQRQTGLNEAVVCGTALIDRLRVKKLLRPF